MRGKKSIEIKEFAEKHPEMTCYQIAKELNVSAPSVYNNIGKRGDTVRQTKRESVIGYLKANPNVTKSKAAKDLKVCMNTVIKYAKELEKEEKGK